MALRLYNTRTRTKEEFKPLDPKHIRMYVCGPTVYDFAHIGNARPVIVFDVLFRLLKYLYEPQGAKVTYVRNITDVDDKINARAAEEGIAIRELTERTAKQFHDDVAALGCLPPTFEPRATETIGEMIALVELLIERGHAYAADGHVLFDVGSMPDYGQLARRSLDEMRVGARVEVAPYKRAAMDFVLWKPSTGNEPGWESPWGYGRPGWHLECSAMSKKYLGETFDIHGGGIDLVFPHHENEVAQSRCAHGTDIMANVWMHNGHLMVEGEKMSKSLGNFVTINELLQDWSGEVLRLNMLRTMYRKPIDWTLKGVEDSARKLERWRTYAIRTSNEMLPEAVKAALEDDLNTSQAITEIDAIISARIGQTFSNDRPRAVSFLCSSQVQNRASQVRAAMRVLGLEGALVDGWTSSRKLVDENAINQLIAARLAARRAKNWAEADRIRDELVKNGIVIMDAKDPTTGEIVTTWERAR